MNLPTERAEEPTKDKGYISTQMERDLRIMGFPELADQFEQTFHSHPAKGLPNTRAVRRFKVHLEPSKTSANMMVPVITVFSSDPPIFSHIPRQQRSPKHSNCISWFDPTAAEWTWKSSKRRCTQEGEREVLESDYSLEAPCIQPLLQFLNTAYWPLLEVSGVLRVFFVPYKLPPPDPTSLKVDGQRGLGDILRQSGVLEPLISTRNVFGSDVIAFRESDLKCPIINLRVASVELLNLFCEARENGRDQSLGVKWIFESWSPLIGDPSLSCTRMLLESDQTDPKVATTWSRCLKDLKSVTLQIYTDASSTGYPLSVLARWTLARINRPQLWLYLSEDWLRVISSCLRLLGATVDGWNFSGWSFRDIQRCHCSGPVIRLLLDHPLPEAKRTNGDYHNIEWVYEAPRYEGSDDIATFFITCHLLDHELSNDWLKKSGFYEMIKPNGVQLELLWKKKSAFEVNARPHLRGLGSNRHRRLAR